MKKPILLARVTRWFWQLIAPVWIVTIAVASVDQPTITAIWLRDSNVVVTARVPAGITKVTLESRSRLGAGAWEPRVVLRLKGDEGEISFTVPRSSELEVLRVRADEQDVLPEYFYRGTNAFPGAPSGNQAGEYYYRNLDLTPTSGAPGGTDAEAKSRDVVESDIWKIRGTTLYFFNQYRGLQVLDISQPAAPVIQGTLNLPAAGEDMYVLNDDYVILLAGNGYNYWGNSSAESRVLVVKIANGVPALAATLPVSGYIQESRLVGTALYVASGAYQPSRKGAEGTWEWGTQVSAFDLSNPAAPMTKGTLWYSGYGNVVTATDRFLFVAPTETSNWQSSRIHCLDISAPDGTMVDLATIVPAGQVADKFKMNMNGEVFTVISQTWTDNRRWVTILETFSLANPANPQKLGKLEFTKAQGEQLHATRFDGNRVYVVTFFRVDPLWVVDLTDPSNPRIAGELEVPGWSTYIQPLGDRLVAIGIDNSNSWRVAVSLFDVRDAANPALISKVPLGDNYSWSEANNDEKAFNVMPDAGLILVPYQGDSTNGYASRVQLIDLKLDDLSSNALQARGAIEHQFQPRRATVFQDSILSISGQELLSVDAANRDNPVVRSITRLAWNVGRVFLKGDYLVEVEDGQSWYWNGQSTPTLRITQANDPNRVLNQLVLTNGIPIAGAHVRGHTLYVVQASQNTIIYTVMAANGQDKVTVTNPPSLYLSIYDLSQLPQIQLVGQVKTDAGPFGGSSFQALWPKDGLLVWTGGGGSYWGGPMLYDARLVGGALWRPFYWGGSGGGQFFAFDVAHPSAPQFLSNLDLSSNSWWNFSSAFTTNGLIYVSHQGSEFLPGVKPPYPPSPIVVYDKTTGLYTTNEPPIGTWVQRYYLDVIDYADPQNPTARKPVNIPGTLRGLSHNGSIIYTVGNHWNTDWTSDWTEWLDAAAYDGVSANLVDSLPLPKDWPHPVLVHGSSIFIGRPDTSTNFLNRIETWVLSDTGRFAQQGAVVQGLMASVLADFGNLLAAQDYQGACNLLDATDPVSLRLVGSGSLGGFTSGNLSQAAGALDRGMWIPLNDYGVQIIDVKAQPAP